MVANNGYSVISFPARRARQEQPQVQQVRPERQRARREQPGPGPEQQRVRPVRGFQQVFHRTRQGQTPR